MVGYAIKIDGYYLKDFLSLEEPEQISVRLIKEPHYFSKKEIKEKIEKLIYIIEKNIVQLENFEIEVLYL